MGVCNVWPFGSRTVWPWSLAELGESRAGCYSSYYYVVVFTFNVTFLDLATL